MQLTSRPVRARGLKRLAVHDLQQAQQSRPVRARGLKLHHRRGPERQPSRPVRARGLKLDACHALQLVICVAPRAGAWIETRRVQIDHIEMAGRAPCGRVD